MLNTCIIERKEENENILLLSNEDAQKLISSNQFINAFRTKSSFLEEALGINEEHSVFIEAHSTIRDIKENSQMEKLTKIGELSYNITNNRAITCLDYDKSFGHRFLASYSGYSSSSSSLNDNIESKLSSDDNKDNISSDGGNNGMQSFSMSTNLECDGLINIFTINSSEYNLLRRLECQSMINP